MKTIENHLSLWSNIFMLLAGSMLTSAEAAVSTKPQVYKTSIPQKLLYKVNAETLEDLKESLVKVNLHMRENADRIRPKIRLALFGEGVLWLQKNNIDPELKNMLEWFQDEEIQVGVDDEWVQQLGIQPRDLSPDVVIMHFQSFPPKED